MSTSTKELSFAIAVVLDPAPKTVSIPNEATRFDAFGECFECVGLGLHNGFYDFLRNGSGAVIGVRYLPSADAEELLKKTLPQGENIRYEHDGSLEVLLIFWSKNKQFDPETSTDQYFGDNNIYRSSVSGRLAISFGIDQLSLLEKSSLFDGVGPDLA